MVEVVAVRMAVHVEASFAWVVLGIVAAYKYRACIVVVEEMRDCTWAAAAEETTAVAGGWYFSVVPESTRGLFSVVQLVTLALLRAALRQYELEDRMRNEGRSTIDFEALMPLNPQWVHQNPGPATSSRLVAAYTIAVAVWHEMRELEERMPSDGHKSTHTFPLQYENPKRWN